MMFVRMGYLNKVLVRALFFSTMAVGQDVVTVSIGTCLSGVGSTTYEGGSGASALPAGPGGTPCVHRAISWLWNYLT